MVYSAIADAFLWGVLSASSYIIGSLIGVFFNIPKKWNSLLLAYGGGALIFALTIELYGVSLCEIESGESDNTGMVLLGIGSLVGAVSFFVLNYFVENRGGFMRKFSLKSEYIRRWQKKNAFFQEEIADNDPVFQVVWVENEDENGSTDGNFVRIEKSYREEDYSDGDAVEEPFEGPDGIEITERAPLNKTERGLSAYRPTTPRPISRPTTPGLYHRHASVRSNFTHRSQRAVSAIVEPLPVPDINANDGHVGIAIWLGLLVDSLPESIVIGILAVDDKGISYTFIAGVFLSNLPEAISSSLIMRRGGMRIWKILFMWTALTLITGLGGALGALLFYGEWSRGKELASKFLEGMAAGAMLVIVAETNLPEAFRFAGNLVGFATLFGFLSAYIVKLLEPT